MMEAQLLPSVLCRTCGALASLSPAGKIQCVGMSCPDRRFPPEHAPEEKARALIEAGYHQVSKRYRKLARVPIYLSPKAARQLSQAGRGLFLRVYSQDVITLSEEVFEAFRKLNGPVA